MRQTILFATLGSLFSILSLNAQNGQNTFTIDTQLRSRAEYRNGALSPRSEGDHPAFFINNRARFSLGYQRERLQMKLSAQHVGVWGQDPQIDRNGRFALNEAWAKIDLGKGLFAQLGRQPLVYDDERLLGSLDWNVAGRFHDALKLGYKREQHQVHLVLAFNQNDEKVKETYYAVGGQPYKTMQTLWYNGQYGTHLNASILFMNIGLETGEPGTDTKKQRGKTTYMQTAGTYITYTSGKWLLSGSGYYQFGKKRVGRIDEPRTVSAYMLGLKADYEINRQWSVSLLSDYLSGDPDSEKVTTFDPLYGTHHKFYGGMDYFYASAYNKGLWDKQLGLTFRPKASLVCSLNYHHFSTTYDVKAVDRSEGRSIGSEIDLQTDYTIAKDVKITLGYSIMLGTKYMDAIKGGNHNAWQDWGWLSININPRILFAKW
ncbi:MULTISPECIES: alginate export family protein [Bacteroides]|uniref:alginate export family protein n=1 Tax=Bacteroides TaxID=816 RepID=UPI0004ADC9F8|nr:alginate export family protein [Bacteroides neonati]